MAVWSPQLYMSGWVGSSGPTRGATWGSPVLYQQLLQNQQPASSSGTANAAGAGGTVSGWVGSPFGPAAGQSAPTGTSNRVLSWLKPPTQRGTAAVQTMRYAPSDTIGQDILSSLGTYQPGVLDQLKSQGLITASTGPRWYATIQWSLRNQSPRQKEVTLLSGGREKVRYFNFGTQYGSARTLTSEERRAIELHNTALQKMQEFMARYPNWVNDPRLQAKIETLRQQLLPGFGSYIDPNDVFIWEQKTERAETEKETPTLFQQWFQGFRRTGPEDQYLRASTEQARQALAQIASKQSEYIKSFGSRAKYGQFSSLPVSTSKWTRRTFTDLATGAQFTGNPYAGNQLYRPPTEAEANVLRAHNIAVERISQIMQTPNWASDPAKVQEYNKMRQYLLPGVQGLVNPYNFLIPTTNQTQKLS